MYAIRSYYDLPDVEFLGLAEVLVDVNLVGAGKCDFHTQAFLLGAADNFEAPGSNHRSNPRGPKAPLV